MDYKDYIDFIYRENNYANIKTSGKQFLRNVAFILYNHAVFLIGSAGIDFHYLSTEEMGNQTLLYKVYWITLYGFILRHRYYIAFSFCQTVADLSGISYNSKKGEIQDDYYNDYYLNISYKDLELDQRCRLRLKSWNMSTQKWLQSTVYDRCLESLGSSKAAMLVFLLSAFWHGFYPVWYLCFFGAFWLNELQRLAFKNEAKLKKIPWVFGFVFSQVLHGCVMNFCGLGIQNAKHWETWQALKNFYFIQLLPMIVVLAFPHYVKLVTTVLGKPKSEKLDMSSEPAKKNE